MPLALVKKLKFNTSCKAIVDGCAYAWAPHKVQSKCTHYQTIDLVKIVRCMTITNVCIEEIFHPFFGLKLMNCQSNPKHLEINM